MSLLKREKETDLPLDDDGAVDKSALAEQDEGQRYDEPGMRTGGNLTRIGSAAARPAGDVVCTGTLVRGNSYRVTYASKALIFEHGEPVPINAVEFEKLQDVTDEVVFHDGDHRVRRRMRKFSFADAAGEPVELPAIEDEIIS